MKRVCLVLAILSLASSAVAQQKEGGGSSRSATNTRNYEVRGVGVTGRAQVNVRGENGRFRLALLPDKGKPVTYSGVLVRKKSRLLLTYTVQRQSKKPGFFKGAAGWLKAPGFNTEAWRPKVTSVQKTEVLSLMEGSWVGTLAGFRQRWTRYKEPRSRTAILVVPGLGTNSWNKVGVPYLDENLSVLKARGFQHSRRLKIQTEASVATNAAFIAREIRVEAAKGRRVYLMAHSKGGTDTTAALAQDPKLRPLVAGVILIQPVFEGSPIADLVVERKVLSGAVKLVFEKGFKGSRKAVSDLSHASRRSFLARYPYPSSEIPTVVIRSSFRPRVSILLANQVLIKSLEPKQENDGMVTLMDQRVPGVARTITLQNLDHFEPGVRGKSPHSPTKVTNIGLDALLLALRLKAKAARRTPAPNAPLGAR